MSALEDGRMVSLNVKDKCNKINASKTIPCIKKRIQCLLLILSVDQVKDTPTSLDLRGKSGWLRGEQANLILYKCSVVNGVPWKHAFTLISCLERFIFASRDPPQPRQTLRLTCIPRGNQLR